MLHSERGKISGEQKTAGKPLHQAAENVLSNGKGRGEARIGEGGRGVVCEVREGSVGCRGLSVFNVGSVTEDLNALNCAELLPPT